MEKAYTEMGQRKKKGIAKYDTAFYSLEFGITDINQIINNIIAFENG